MYRKILVAIDDSRSASLALDEAIKIAREQQSTLRILHVIDVGLTVVSGDVKPRDLGDGRRIGVGDAGIGVKGGAGVPDLG